MSYPTGSDWLKEEEATLKRKYQLGWTYSAIASLLGKKRNAIAGKVRRMGLTRTVGQETFFNKASVPRVKMNRLEKPAPVSMMELAFAAPPKNFTKPTSIALSVTPPTVGAGSERKTAKEMYADLQKAVLNTGGRL